MRGVHKKAACVAAIFLLPILFNNCVFGAGSHPLGLNENFSYGILTSGYESPHVKWAKPYAGGTIKILVMAPEWSQRETVELAQRLSIDYTPWMTSAFTQIAVPAEWFWIPPPVTLMDKLLRRYIASDFDVIVIGKLDWKMLPAKQRFDILKRVSEGTGLVYVGPPEGNAEIDLVYSRKAAPQGVEFIRKGIPFSYLPQLKKLDVDKIVRAGMFGKGRVVALDYGQKVPEEKRPDGTFASWATVAYPALTPQWDNPQPGTIDKDERSRGYIPPDECPEAEFVPYEYYQSLVARAVVWASGKESGSFLSDISLSDIVNYPASAQKATVKTASAPSGSVLNAVVRSRYDSAITYGIPPQPARETNSVALPSVPSGEYILDIWLVSSDGKIFDWASRGFNVKADVEIKEIALDRPSYNSGGNITGTVSLSRSLAGGEVLIAELWDNYNRKLKQKQLSGSGEKYPFSLTVTRPLVIMHSIRARVERKGSDVCSKRFDFPVRPKLKGLDDFNEIVWSGAENYFLTHLMLRKLAESDQTDAIDVGWRGGTHARNVAMANLAAVPYTAGYGGFASKVVPVAPQGPWGIQNLMGGCMTHPETWKYIDEYFSLQGKIFGPYGPFAWSHGDESYYASNPDTCWSETCLAHLREYLKGVYPDLAALNREWKTGYKTWDEVMPLTFEEALNTGNYAPWVEHRLAQQFVFGRLYQHTGEALSAGDPGAIVGFDGNLGFGFPNGGINWWVLKDYIGILQSYIGNSEQMEIIRSFAGPKNLTGMWYGTYGLTWQAGPNTVEYHHFFPWYSLLHGLNSTWFWTMGGPGLYSGYAPDFTNMPFMQASRDALSEIRSGTGKLLLAGKLQDDGIAIHYSEASHIMDSILGGKSDNKLEGGTTIDVKRPVTSIWIDSLSNFNKALEDSGLQYKYVAYKEVEDGALASRGYRVFIMPHSYSVSEKEAEAIRRFVNEGGLLIADIMPGILNGHGTRQEKSMLADLFPSQETGVVNRVGKGKTVLLGNKLADYGYASFRNMQGWSKLEGRYRILGDLIEKEAGVKPQVVITSKEGNMPPTEIFRIKSGDIEYTGLLRNYFFYDNKPYPATIRFSRKSHLYDMRSGKYLGFTDTVDTSISYEAQLYALLPYRVYSLTVSGPRSAARGENTVFNIAVTPDGRFNPSLHMARMEITDPAGTLLPWYGANIRAEGGRASYTVNWALNEKPGKYVISARDIATGVICRKTVDIR